MPLAATVRREIEAVLAHRIPSALTPAPKIIRPVAATGVEPLDKALQGGLPLGAISELVGAEGSGRTSLALSFLAGITRACKVCAWIDVSDALDPVSVAAAGVDLNRLLWIRCGVRQACSEAQATSSPLALPRERRELASVAKELHGGGFGPHPRTEARGMSAAVDGLLGQSTVSVAERKPARPAQSVSHAAPVVSRNNAQYMLPESQPRRPWSRLEQALRTTDLLLQAGGFGAIVVDMGSLSAEFVSRVPLATWYRYRAAAERTQSSVVLLTQHSCAKSSADVELRLQPGRICSDDSTVFTGIEHAADIVRSRFAQEAPNVVAICKPPRRAEATWHSRTAWAGCR